MAQHDYVIANASGASVRADINGMALAISSNNSGSSNPSTTYAYEFWADTSANLLKIRNGANNAWITLPFSITANNTVDINGGAIDGTNIGASSAGTGAFTTLSASGALTVGGDIDLAGGIDVDGTSNLDIVDIDGAFTQDGGAVFNEAGADVDFRVEADANANMLFVDAGVNSGKGAVIVGHNASLGQNRAFQITGTTSDSGGMEMLKYSNDTSGPTISLSKSRGGSIGTAAAVQDNDVVGTINWFADDGTDTSNYTATISSQIDGTPGTNDTPGNLVFSTTPDGANSPTEKMRIQANGNVGIGTTAPDTILHLKDSGDTVLTLEGGATDANCRVQFHNSAGAFRGFLSYDTDDNNLQFNVNDGERMRINDAGLVCIGDTTERSGDQDTIKALQVTGGEAVMGIKNESVTDPSHRGMIVFTINDNSAQGRITCNNSATLFTSLSDYRLKEVLEPLPNGLDRLNQLNPVKFKWKKQGYNAEGFLAHEVAEIYPEAVSGEKDGKDMQSMDYGRITPLLVKAIQEQQTIIEDLKTRIETLEGE